MSDTKHAGRYLAVDRGAFEAEPEAAAEPNATATAPLAETAVQHREPERIVAFIRWMESLA